MYKLKNWLIIHKGVFDKSILILGNKILKESNKNDLANLDVF